MDWSKYRFRLREFKGVIDDEMYASLDSYQKREQAQRLTRAFTAVMRVIGYALVVIGWWTATAGSGRGKTCAATCSASAG